MKVYKRGETFCYEFELNGKQYKKGTRLRDRRRAEARAASEMAKLAKEVTLREFQAGFLEHLKARGYTATTLRSYQQSLAALLKYPRLADAPISDISEGTLAEFKHSTLARDQVSKATINRYLSVLRIVLNHAHKQRLITFVPHFDRFKRESREPYIFSDADYRKWLDCSREPLKSMSVLARGTGMRVGEMLALQKNSVHLLDDPDETGAFGHVEVGTGLKPVSYHRRIVPLSRELRDMLRALISRSEGPQVFTSPTNPAKPLAAGLLTRQVADARTKGGFAKGVCLHALRATFISKMLEVADPHIVARIVGYSIPTTIRFMNFHWDRHSTAKLLGCTDNRIAHSFVGEPKPASQFQQAIRKLWANLRLWVTQKFVPMKKKNETSRSTSLALEGAASKN